MIPTIPYSHYYWVGGPPKVYCFVGSSFIAETSPSGQAQREGSGPTSASAIQDL